MNKRNDIVITGMGIITSLGVGKEETYQKLITEQEVIGPIRYIDTKHHQLPSGEVTYSDDELKALLGYDNSQKITRTSLLGCVALREALLESHLDKPSTLRVAFINGNTVGGMEKSERFYYDFLNNDTRNEYIALHDCGSCTELIAQEYPGNFTLTTTISTACSSAANAVILGANLLKTGQADIAIVGGTECLSKFHINGFNTLMILDSAFCRPFDANRHGLNLGEGAAYLVMESEETARQRQATAICKLSGYGNACDAFHQTATSPNGEGAYRAMTQALLSSGLKPSDIGYINAHGTGTGNNDECEGIAMMRIFGEQMPPVSSTKSYTGHTTSAAGSVESVISILAMIHHFIPANLRYQNAIEGHTFQPNNHVIKNIKLNHILTNSFGFGGNDSSCIFSELGTQNDSRHETVSTKALYIQSAAHISIQQPLTTEWFEHPIIPQQPYNESIEPPYTNYFTPIAARRMGKLLKRAVATGVEALGKHELPDAIISGTGLGCIDNTEKFLKAMIDNDEEFLQPTYFMQSTHNTISSQVALHLKCHGYNCTYSHRGTSFDSSLYDAYLQMRLNLIHSALVGSHDEMTPDYFRSLEKIGYWKSDNISEENLRKAETPGSLSGSCSMNMLISDQPEEGSLCVLNGISLLYKPTLQQLCQQAYALLQQAGISKDDLSAIVSGLSGDCDNDKVYNEFASAFGPNIPSVWYKHIFGESYCSSSFGVYVGATILHKQQIPDHLIYKSNKGLKQPQYILVHNHFQNKDHSLVLLSQC